MVPSINFKDLVRDLYYQSEGGLMGTWNMYGENIVDSRVTLNPLLEGKGFYSK